MRHPIPKTVTLGAEADRRLIAAAQRCHVRPGELIRRAIVQYLDYIEAVEQHAARLNVVRPDEDAEV